MRLVLSHSAHRGSQWEPGLLVCLGYNMARDGAVGRRGPANSARWTAERATKAHSRGFRAAPQIREERTTHYGCASGRRRAPWKTLFSSRRRLDWSSTRRCQSRSSTWTPRVAASDRRCSATVANASAHRGSEALTNSPDPDVGACMLSGVHLYVRLRCIGVPKPLAVHAR